MARASLTYRARRRAEATVIPHGRKNVVNVYKIRRGHGNPRLNKVQLRDRRKALIQWEKSHDPDIRSDVAPDAA